MFVEYITTIKGNQHSSRTTFKVYSFTVCCEEMKEWWDPGEWSGSGIMLDRDAARVVIVDEYLDVTINYCPWCAHPIETTEVKVVDARSKACGVKTAFGEPCSKRAREDMGGRCWVHR